MAVINAVIEAMKKRNNNIVLAEITDQLDEDVRGIRTTKLIDEKNFDTYVDKGDEKDRFETKKMVYHIAVQTALPFHKLIDKEMKTKLLKEESIATNESYHEQLTECIAGYIVNTDPINTNRDEIQKQIVETLQAALAKDKDFGMTHGRQRAHRRRREGKHPDIPLDRWDRPSTYKPKRRNLHSDQTRKSQMPKDNDG